MSDHEPYGVDHGRHDDAPTTPDRRGGVATPARAPARAACRCLVSSVLVARAAGVVPGRAAIDLKQPVRRPTAEDFPGPGSGAVVFTVVHGRHDLGHGRNLEDLGVVASAEAFVEAAAADDASRSIREGVYRLKKEMKAADVVDLAGRRQDQGHLVHLHRRQDRRRGRRRCWPRTPTSAASSTTPALADPAAIGLPDDGRAATPRATSSPGSYTFFPDDDATTILSAMVARTVENARRRSTSPAPPSGWATPSTSCSRSPA